MNKLRTLFACLAVGFLLFYANARTPAPIPASAPPTQFAAGRALPDIALMSRAPHPQGSRANIIVRDELIQRMTDLGLTPITIQRDQSHFEQSFPGQTIITGGDVENVIGVLPGRDHRLPALALMAHYDSVQGSPGAADDITGVAAALEIVRAIKAEGVPARDVMVVITDGEETGLLGATAFFADHPLASQVGFVLNLDTRGGGGRTIMFETGDDNGGAIDLYRRTAVRPNANSLSVFLYKHLPNGTDFTMAKAKGIPGLNYAFIGRQFDYHAPSSTVTALDQGAVQHMGEQALGTARAIAFSNTLPARTPDKAYGNLVGSWIVAYPAWGGWLVLAVAAGLLAVAALRARRMGPLAWIDGLRGAGAGLFLLVGAAAAMHLVRHATGYGSGWIAGRPLLARFPVYEAAIALAGMGVLMLTAAGLARGPMRRAVLVAALAVGAASSLFGGLDVVGLGEGAAAGALALAVFGRPIGVFAGWLGVLVVGLIAATALQIWAPTIALTIAWPLIVGAACAALTAAPHGRRPTGWLIALGLAALGMAWLANLFHSLLQSLDLPELPALVVWLASFSLWPLVWPEPEDAPRATLTPGAALLAGGVMAALWLNFTDPYSPRHPEAVMPLYVLDRDSGKAWRVSPFKPNAWVRGVLTADGGEIGHQPLATFDPRSWTAPARLVAASAPDVTVARGPAGTVSLHARADADQVLDLALSIAGVAGKGLLNGKPVDLPAEPGGKLFIRWVAAPEGFVLSFKPTGPGPVKVAYAAYRRAWPADAKPLPALPETMMDWDMFGSTVVVGAASSSP
jgi:hypothetical protein